MADHNTEYGSFESLSESTRRLLRQEEFILAVTVALSQALERSGNSKSVLAAKLGRDKSFVTQVLSGGRNLTLRTIADFADALGVRPEFDLFDEEVIAESKLWSDSITTCFQFSSARTSDWSRSLKIISKAQPQEAEMAA